jgi:hypothetical protein
MLTNGNEERQFIYVENVCEAMETTMLKYDELDKNEYYDITSYEWSSINQIAEIVKQIIPCEIYRNNNEPQLKFFNFKIRNTHISYFLISNFFEQKNIKSDIQNNSPTTITTTTTATTSDSLSTKVSKINSSDFEFSFKFEVSINNLFINDYFYMFSH